MTISHKTINVCTILLLFVGILHHLDHILRYDHSGWPFRPEITPFTFSLLVYPVIVSLFLIKQKTYRISVSTVLAVLLIGAHIFLETPIDQFTTWAHDSSVFSYSLGHPNLLHLSSPLLGIVSVTLGMILNIGVLLLPFAFGKEEKFEVT
jgi:hypothetical protein